MVQRPTKRPGIIMPLKDHLTLEEIQTLIDIANETLNASIPIERKKAIEDQVKIMPLNEANYIFHLVQIKLISKIDYLEQMKQEKLREMQQN